MGLICLLSSFLAACSYDLGQSGSSTDLNSSGVVLPENTDTGGSNTGGQNTGSSGSSSSAPKDTFIATLDADGGVTSQQSQEMKIGTSFTLPVPSKKGYVFTGWSADGTTKLTDNTGKGLQAWDIRSDVTLKAMYDLRKITLVFVFDGNELKTKPYDITQDLDEVFTEKIDVLTAPIWGWFKDSSMTQFVKSYDDMVIGSDDKAKVYCKRAEGFTIQDGILTKTDATKVQGVVDFSHLYLNGKRITGIGGLAFKGSKDVTVVVLPKEIAIVRDYAFSSTNGKYIILCEAQAQPSTWRNLWKDISHVVVWNALGEVKVENGIKYAPLSSGGNSIVGYDTSKGTSVVVPETLEGKPVTEVASSAFWNSGIVSISLPKTIASINAEAFHYSKSLTKVTLNEGIKIIGDSAFYQCTKLNTIN